MSLTVKGKKCKKCEKKGSICKQHLSMDISSSVKSKTSAIRSSPFPVEDLTKNVLFQMMLELPKEQLNALCRSSKKYAAICRNDLFRKLYNAKHINEPSMFVGELIWKDKPDFRYVAKDSIGNKLIIQNNEEGEYVIEYAPKKQENKDSIDIMLIFRNNKLNSSVIKVGSTRGVKKTEVENYLKSIGKLHWLHKNCPIKSTDINRIPSCKLNKKGAKEFLNIVKREVNKIENDKFRTQINEWLN